jgi:hypothetical protein
MSRLSRGKAQLRALISAKETAGRSNVAPIEPFKRKL